MTGNSNLGPSMPVPSGKTVWRSVTTDTSRRKAESGSTWDRVLTADTRVSRGAVPPGLGSYVSETWRRVQARLFDRMSQEPANAVLFLHDAGLLGRYWEAGGRRFLTDLQH